MANKIAASILFRLNITHIYLYIRYKVNRKVENHFIDYIVTRRSSSQRIIAFSFSIQLKYAREPISTQCYKDNSHIDCCNGIHIYGMQSTGSLKNFILGKVFNRIYQNTGKDDLSFCRTTHFIIQYS